MLFALITKTACGWDNDIEMGLTTFDKVLNEHIKGKKVKRQTNRNYTFFV